MSVELLISAFVTLFVVIDPIGIAPIFAALTGHLEPAARRSVALRAVVISAVVLLAFGAFGQQLLTAMGITLPAFRVAGGLLLFWISAEMVFEKRQARKTGSTERSMQEDHPSDLAAFPLAVPLMAGPGAITAVILLAGNIPHYASSILAVAIVTIAVLAITLVILLLAIPLDRLLGATIRAVVTRLLGVILAALAVQFVADGIAAMIGG